MAVQYFGQLVDAAGARTGSTAVSSGQSYNLWMASAVTCPGSGCQALRSIGISCYEFSPTGQIRLGLYDSGGNKIAQTTKKSIPDSTEGWVEWTSSEMSVISLGLTGGQTYTVFVEQFDQGIRSSYGSASGMSYNAVDYSETVLPATLPSPAGSWNGWPIRIGVEAGIARTGSTQTQVVATGESGTWSNIAIPADAELLVVGVGGYYSGNGNFSGYPPSFGGSVMTLGRGEDYIDFYQSVMFYLPIPVAWRGTTKNLTYAWGGSPGADSTYFELGFYRGVHATTPVRTSAGNHLYSPEYTGTITHVDGDFAVCFASIYIDAVSVTWTNADEVSEWTGGGAGVNSWAEKVLTSDLVITATPTGTNTDGSLCVLVLQPAAGEELTVSLAEWQTMNEISG